MRNRWGKHDLLLYNVAIGWYILFICVSNIISFLLLGLRRIRHNSCWGRVKSNSERFSPIFVLSLPNRKLGKKWQRPQRFCKTKTVRYTAKRMLWNEKKTPFSRHLLIVVGREHWLNINQSSARLSCDSRDDAQSRPILDGKCVTWQEASEARADLSDLVDS